MSKEPDDKQFVVTLIPIRESFSHVEPGDYSNAPENEPPKPMNNDELSMKLNTALTESMQGKSYIFKISESFYLHALMSSV